MKDMIVTDYLSSCRPKMKRNENINPIFTCLHDDTEEMKKKFMNRVTVCVGKNCVASAADHGDRVVVVKSAG